MKHEEHGVLSTEYPVLFHARAGPAWKNVVVRNNGNPPYTVVYLSLEDKSMKTYTAVVEQDRDTKLYVGYVPGFPGAHSQGETLDELRENLREVISATPDESSS